MMTKFINGLIRPWRSINALLLLDMKFLLLFFFNYKFFLKNYDFFIIVSKTRIIK